MNSWSILGVVIVIVIIVVIIVSLWASGVFNKSHGTPGGPTTTEGLRRPRLVDQRTAAERRRDHAVGR